MPYTNYADGTIIFASQLNADNATSLDINTTSPLTVQSTTVTFNGLVSASHTNNGLLTLAGGTVDSVKVLSSGVSYAVLPTDRYILCQTGSVMVIGLPSGPATGRIISVKDSGGTAGTSTITITPASGLIDGQTSYVISANYGTVKLIWSGTKWLSIS